MNVIILSGFLVETPELKQTPKGKAVTEFGLAVPRDYVQEGEYTADFFTCKAFGSNAEFASKYLLKGMRIEIIGSCHNRRYTTKSGKKGTANEIKCKEIRFGERKQQTAAPSSPVDFSEMNIDAELPFE